MENAHIQMSLKAPSERARLMKRRKQHSATCGALASQQMARYSWEPPTLPRVSASSSLLSGWNSTKLFHER